MNFKFLRETTPLLFDGMDENAFDSLSSSLLAHGAIKTPFSQHQHIGFDIDRGAKGVLHFLETYERLPHPNRVTVVCAYFHQLNADRKVKDKILEKVDKYDWGVYCSLL